MVLLAMVRDDVVDAVNRLEFIHELFTQGRVRAVEQRGTL